MSRIVFAVMVAVSLTLMAGLTKAADEKKSTTVSGVLIDTKCGAGKNEEAAAKHAKACCISCEKSGYEVVAGEKTYKFDDNGNKLAKEYLAKDESQTKVVVEGTVKDDGSIAVTSIKAQKTS